MGNTRFFLIFGVEACNSPQVFIIKARGELQASTPKIRKNLVLPMTSQLFLMMRMVEYFHHLAAILNKSPEEVRLKRTVLKGILLQLIWMLMIVRIVQREQRLQKRPQAKVLVAKSMFRDTGLGLMLCY